MALAKTDLVLICDVDFRPCQRLARLARASDATVLGLLKRASCRLSCIVLPAFEALVPDDEDDDDEPDPDDIEEDLDAILKDRLSAGDDEDEEDEEEDDQVVKKPVVVAEGDVTPKQEGEWTCMSCFLIVTKAAASASICPHCGAERE